MLTRLQSNRNSHSLLMGMQHSSATLEERLAASYKSNHTLDIWSSDHTPYYLPEWLGKLCPHKNLHLNVYTNFTIAKTWKQPRCLSVIDKTWYIQTMKYYSLLQRNELSNHKETWKNLKCIFLSEISQSENATYSMTPITWHSEKTMETVKKTKQNKVYMCVCVTRWLPGAREEGGMNRQSTEDLYHCGTEYQ